MQPQVGSELITDERTTVPRRGCIIQEGLQHVSIVWTAVHMWQPATWATPDGPRHHADVGLILLKGATMLAGIAGQFKQTQQVPRGLCQPA